MLKAFFQKLIDNHKYLVLVSLIFVAINTIFILNEFFWFGLFSLALLVGLAFIYAPDKILIFISFLTPIAVNLSDFDMQIGLSIPTEPLLVLLLILVIAKFLFDHSFDRKILLHPLSLSLYFYFFWMAITIFTSEFPIVSLKWFIAKLWLIVPIFFLGSHVFKNPKNIWYFVNAYIIGFVIVIFYTLYNHGLNGFSSESGHWVMTPFYNDHTSYGAMLAFFIPYLTIVLFLKSIKSNLKLLLFALLSLFVVAIVFSISRAAWASLIFAFGLWVILYFKINFKIIIAIASVAILLFFAYQPEIMMKLQKNKQDAKGGLKEHVESVSNVATDASNLERINRWNSAIRMFEKRPFFGWGPGSFQFIYAPFQKSYEKTVISTNSGNQGTAHSEYLLILSEEGFPGLLSLILVFSIAVIVGIRNNYQLIEPKLKLLNMALLLGLSTYLAHAFFNNFLDTDKAAVPFWGFVAALLSLSVFAQKHNSINDSRIE